MSQNISSIKGVDRISFNDQFSDPQAAYVHIPFCRRRCYYCDFPISVVGDQGRSNSSMVEDYLAALIQEIQLTPVSVQPLKSIFFGGGTPSLLAPQQIAQIVQTLSHRFGLDAAAEISVEIDPGTFDRAKLLGYLAAGANRFSLGVQSFDEELLKVCGRSHSLADVMQSLKLIQQLDIDNFSLDLISGLPHQTLEHCHKSLAQAIAIAPKHLSCYDLVLEPVTAFGKKFEPGTKPLPNDEDAAQMYRLTQQQLTNAGYGHYEVSNYAQPDYQCRHNRVYWENKSYYGFGMGAASYVAGKRFSRPRTRKAYYEWLNSGAAIDVEPVDHIDQLLEALMLGLRLVEGVSLEQFSQEEVQKILSCLQPYAAQGWIEALTENNQPLNQQNFLDLDSIPIRLRLQDPEGFLFSNTILTSLFENFE